MPRLSLISDGITTAQRLSARARRAAQGIRVSAGNAPLWVAINMAATVVSWVGCTAAPIDAAERRVWSTRPEGRAGCIALEPWRSQCRRSQTAVQGRRCARAGDEWPVGREGRAVERAGTFSPHAHVQRGAMACEAPPDASTRNARDDAAMPVTTDAHLHSSLDPRLSPTTAQPSRGAAVKLCGRRENYEMQRISRIYENHQIRIFTFSLHESVQAINILRCVQADFRSSTRTSSWRDIGPPPRPTPIDESVSTSAVREGERCLPAQTP